MEFFKSFKKMLRAIRVKFLPMTVHTESIYLDYVWSEIKKRIKDKSIHTWYLMTPTNYEYFRGSLLEKRGKLEVSKIMKKRYLEMKKAGENLQFHVHLQIAMHMTYEEQDLFFKEGLNWLKKEIGISPTEVVFGWWLYDENSVKLAKKYGLKIITYDDYNSCHDYEWATKCLGESYN